MKARKLVGWNIARLRLSLGRSQEDLADRCRIERAYMGKIERGSANVTIDKLENIARALRVSIGDLFASKPVNARLPTPLKKGPKSGT